MSARQKSNNLENLFSLELFVEHVRIGNGNVSDELAVAVRLLDFPTLLIYQPQQESGDKNLQEQNENAKRGEYAFNRGKSCFFKMNLNSLHTHLSTTPLYAMVLDVKEDIPKLVGSSMISLAKAIDRINQDVTEHGVSTPSSRVSTPSSHGERTCVYISNLTGEKTGSISLSFKLLSLGTSLLPHARDRRDLKSIKVHEEQCVQECDTETNVSTESLTPDCSPKNIQTNRLANTKTFRQDDNAVCVDAEHTPRSQTPQTPEGENNVEEDLTIFCPPHLYYTNSAEEENKAEGGDFALPNLEPEAFTFEDSEDETAPNKAERPASPVMHQQVRQNAPMLNNQETSGLSPNVLGEALRQLPLLNALLVELSQLTGQNLHQPLSIHPNLSCIYRPAATEPPAGQENAPQKALVKSFQKTEQLKKLHAPRNCSTPVFRPAYVRQKDKQEEALTESKSPSKSPRKKLVYGTTKTFNLRMKQISPPLKRRECMGLTQNDRQSSVAKGKTKSSKKIIRSSQRKAGVNQSFSLNEDIETMIQSVTVDSAIRETITLTQKNTQGKRHAKQDRDSQTISEQQSFSERDLKLIRIPTVNSDSVAQNKDKNEHHSESDQTQSQFDRRREKIESSGSSRRSSPKSSFSDSSGEGNEEADYADDFNSLEPSDTCSPDPMSSPEPSRAKTPKSPVCLNFSYSDSGSESVQKRTVLPVPIKAPSSPQRALRGTHIIRPRTQASALSFSSDDYNRDGSAFLRTECSRKNMTKSSSRSESFILSRGEGSESTKTSGPVRGFSADSMSSIEPQEAEELEDELGSLDFRKEYQHISELVANKLPGYTM